MKYKSKMEILIRAKIEEWNKTMVLKQRFPNLLYWSLAIGMDGRGIVDASGVFCPMFLHLWHIPEGRTQLCASCLTY